MNIFEELNRRGVVRAAAMYVAEAATEAVSVTYAEFIAAGEAYLGAVTRAAAPLLGD